MEGEGLDDIRAFFRKKLLRMGVLTPDEEERKELDEERANTPPSPQDQYFRAAAAKEQTEAVKNEVETISEQAKADKLRAETQEILNGLNLEKLTTLVNVIEKLGPRIEPGSVS